MSMSTPNGNVKVRAASGNAVEIAPPAQDVTAAEPNLTAAQVKARLQEIGREITARLAKADKQTQLAEDHVIAVNKLLDEAKELCDVDDFKKFHELYCPKLGKSQAYALLAIAAGKKSFEETRASGRKRVAKHRANKAEASISVTVTEKSEPGVESPPPEDVQKAEAPVSVTVTENSGLEPLGASIEDGTLRTTSILPEQTPEPAKVRRGRTHGEDDTLRDFSARVLDLDRSTDKKPARRFAGTTVSADKLARLGKLFSELANLKKSDAAKPVAALPGNGTVIPDSQNSTGDINESSQASNA